jgi:uncharacterized protein involved in exopolysaccharide biosynthesis
MTIIDALNIIFKHRRTMASIFVTVVAVVAAVTFLQKPVYEARASLLVKMLKDATPRPGMVVENNSLSLTLSQEELINTEIQVLTGQDLAEKVINSVTMARLYPDLARKDTPEKTNLTRFQAVQAFHKNLKVIGVRKSNVITLTFQHHDPQLAARVVNLLIEKYNEKHLTLHSDPQSSFVGSQLTAFEKKLKSSERALQEYQQQNNAFSLDEQRALLLRQRTDFDSAYKIAYDNISELRKKIGALRGQIKYLANSTDRYTHTDRDKIITDAKSRLLELQLKEQELRRKYTAGNRLVVDAKNEVNLVNHFLKEQEEGIAGKVKTGNPVYQSVEMDLYRAEADLNSQVAKADALKNQIRQLDQKLLSLDMSENKIQELRRDVAINEKNFKTYADRHEEARISDEMNKHKLSNISVIQSAIVPAKPIKPKKKINLLIGAVFGIFAAFGWAYVLENVGQTFSDPESVEKYLGLPVLLTVSSKEG